MFQELQSGSGGSSTSDSGSFALSTSSETINIPVKIKATYILMVAIKDSSTVGTWGCKFNSDGSQNLIWFGDTYSGGRFMLNNSAMTYARNSDNTITYYHAASSYLGGTTVYWVACE